MDDKGTVARPYAMAAFQQAREEGKVAEWADMLDTVATVLRDPTMKGLVSHPKVERSQLRDLILDICGDRLSDTGRNFVKLLVEKSRLGVVDEIEAQFARERAKVEGKREVTVLTAFDLDGVQRQALAGRIASRLGAEVDLKVEVDKSLIGGVVIRAGDMVIDASLRGRLSQLASAL